MDRSRWAGLPVYPLILAAGLLLPIPHAVAADGVERPFNPAIGSKWIIQSDEAKQDEADGSIVSKSTKKITATFSYDEKLADGYRITYRRTASTYDSDGDDVAAMRAGLAALQDHTFRVVTDRAGKPLRLENLAELRAALQKMVDGVAGSNSDPQVADAARTMMADFANVDETQAAAKNLDELPVLALGQNTGLKLGEVRQQTVEEPVPGATPIKKTVSLTIFDAAPDGAKLRLKLTEASDPESMRAMLLAYLGKLDASSPDVRERLDIVKKMQFTQERQTEIEVVDGMTRSLHVEMVTAKEVAGGGNTRITEHKAVTVTPAP